MLFAFSVLPVFACFQIVLRKRLDLKLVFHLMCRLFIQLYQADDQLRKIQEMQGEIENIQSKNHDCEKQLNRCEEVLQDLTEKLAEKQKEVCNVIQFKLARFDIYQLHKAHILSRVSNRIFALNVTSGSLVYNYYYVIGSNTRIAPAAQRHDQVPSILSMPSLIFEK